MITSKQYFKKTNAQLNKEHPLLKDAVFIVFPGSNSTSNLITNELGRLLDTATWEGRVHPRTGYSLETFNTSNQGAYWSFPSFLANIGTQYTIVVRANPIGLTTSSELLSIPYRESGWSSPFEALGLSRHSTTTEGLTVFSDPTNRVVTSDAGFIQTTDGLTTYGAVRINTTALFYRHGRQHGTTKTFSANGVPDLSNSRPINLMNRSDSSPGNGIQGQVAFAGIWLRALTAEEMLELDRILTYDPAKLFEEPKNRKYFQIVSSFTALSVEQVATYPIPKFSRSRGKVDLKQKPQSGSVVLDTDHSILSRGFIGAWLFNEGSGRISRALPSTQPQAEFSSALTDNTWMLGERGYFLSINSGGRVSFANNSALHANSSELSLVYVAKWRGAGGGVVRGQDGFGSGWSVSIGRNAGTGLLEYAIVTGGSQFSANPTTSLPLNEWAMMGGRVRRSAFSGENTLTSFLNGRRETTNTHNGSDFRSSTIGYYLIDNNFDIALLYVWDRALQDEEFKELATNPYTIFKPLTYRRWFQAPFITSAAENVVTNLEIDVADDVDATDFLIGLINPALWRRTALKRARKFQRNIRLNRTHPIAVGLRVGWVLNSGVVPYDVVKGQFAGVNGSLSIEPGPEGIGLRFNGGNNDIFSHNFTNTELSNHTQFIVFSPVALPSGQGASIGSLATAATSPISWTGLVLKADGKINQYDFDGGQKNSTTPNAVTLGKLHIAAGVTKSGAYIKAFLDGIASTPTAFGNKILGTWAFRVGNTSNNFDSRLNAKVYMVLFWDRALNDQEIITLSRDPYLLLEGNDTSVIFTEVSSFEFVTHFTIYVFDDVDAHDRFNFSIGILATRLYRKPRVGTQLNKEHPLLKDAVFIVFPGGGRRTNLITGDFGQLAGNSATWDNRTYSRTGMAVGSSNTSSGPYWTHPNGFHRLGTQYSVVIRSDITSIGNWGRMLTVPYRQSGWSVPYNSLSFGRGEQTGTKGGFGYAINGSDTRDVQSDAGFLQTTDGLTTYAAIRLDRLVIFYRNGRQYGSTKTYGGNELIDFNERRPVSLLNRSDSSPGEGMSGGVIFAGIWARTLTAEEMLELDRILTYDPTLLFIDNGSDLFSIVERTTVFIELVTPVTPITLDVYDETDVNDSAGFTAIALLKSRYYTKPSSANSQLNRNHLLTRGLALLWLCNESTGDLRDLVTSIRGKSSTLGWKLGTGGWMLDVRTIAGRDNYSTTTGAILPFAASDPFTLQIEIYLTSAPNDSAVFSIGDPSTTGSGTKRGILTDLGSGLTIAFWGKGADLDSGVPWRLDGLRQNIVITSAGAGRAMVFYRNGQRIFSGTTPAGLATSATDVWIGGGAQMVTDVPTMGVTKASIYRRQLTDGEVAWLDAEPFSMLIGLTSKFYTVDAFLVSSVSIDIGITITPQVEDIIIAEDYVEIIPTIAVSVHDDNISEDIVERIERSPIDFEAFDTIPTDEYVEIATNPMILEVDDVISHDEALILNLNPALLETFDTLTALDEVTIEYIIPVSVFDTTVVDEHVTCETIIPVEVFDTISITDAIDVLIPQLMPFVYDELSTTEFIEFGHIHITVSDSATITEAVDFLFTLTVDIFDTRVISEFTNLSLPREIFIIDERTAVGFINVAPQRLINVSDTRPIDELVTFKPSIRPSVADSVTVVENVNVTLGLQVLPITWNVIQSFQARIQATWIAYSSPLTKALRIEWSVKSFVVAFRTMWHVLPNTLRDIFTTSTNTLFPIFSIRLGLSIFIGDDIRVKDVIGSGNPQVFDTITSTDTAKVDAGYTIQVFDDPAPIEHVTVLRIASVAISEVVAETDAITVKLMMARLVFDTRTTTENLLVTTGNRLLIQISSQSERNESLTVSM